MDADFLHSCWRAVSAHRQAEYIQLHQTVQHVVLCKSVAQMCQLSGPEWRVCLDCAFQWSDSALCRNAWKSTKCFSNLVWGCCGGNMWLQHVHRGWCSSSESKQFLNLRSVSWGVQYWSSDVDGETSDHPHVGRSGLLGGFLPPPSSPAVTSPPPRRRVSSLCFLSLLNLPFGAEKNPFAPLSHRFSKLSMGPDDWGQSAASL